MPAVKRRKAAEAPIEDEFAGLDEELAALESATDLDDLDIDEPKDEELDDDEEPVVKRRSKKTKAKAAPVEDEEDDEEEDDEEEEDVVDAEVVDEDDEFEGMDRVELKAYNTKNELGVRVLKSMSDDDLRDALREAADAQGVDGEDEEDEEEPEPPKKPRGRPKKTDAPKRAPKEPSDTPQFTSDDVATIGNVPEHQVRSFARKYPKAFPKASPKARYAFNARQVRALLKGMGVVGS